jgi:hypothetical protein
MYVSSLRPPPPFHLLPPMPRRPEFHCKSTSSNSKDGAQLSALLADLSSNPSAEILDALRGLERKTSLVFTLLKASVYSIVLQQQIGEEDMGDSVGHH